MRRGSTTGPPPGQTFGPTVGRQAVIDQAGPDSVSDPGGGQTFATLSELQTKINASAANSIFVATASSYTASGFTWNAGKHPRIYFPGAPGTRTITGGGANVIGFNCPTGGFEIYGGTFTSFGTAASTFQSAIVAPPENIVIQDAEVTNCWRGFGLAQTGGNGTVILRRLSVHDNFAYGLVVSGQGGEATASLEHSKLYNQPTLHGGDFNMTKFLHCQNGVWRRNHVYDTRNLDTSYDADFMGGLWWDASGPGHDIYDNVIEDIFHRGIFYEISGGNTHIRNNYLKDNGYGPFTFGTYSPLAETQLSISNCDGNTGMVGGVGVDVHNNYIDGESNGIMAYDVNTHWNSSGLRCNQIHAYDNDIWMRTFVPPTGTAIGRNGLADVHNLNFITDPARGNTFESDSYHISGYDGTQAQWEADGQRTFVEFKAFGHEASGTAVAI